MKKHLSSIFCSIIYKNTLLIYITICLFSLPIVGEENASILSPSASGIAKGFLEKDYSVSKKILEGAIDSLFQKCMESSVTVLTDDNDKTIGMIRCKAIGDKNGKWNLGGAKWNGLGTIKELNIPENGIDIEVKQIWE